MKLCIADPPYLGRAAIWYGASMDKTKMGAIYGGISKVAYKPADYHPEAYLWDKPEKHQALIKELEQNYDGFALCMAHDNLQVLLPMFSTKVKVCIWHKWTLPGGSSIVNTYEPVIVKVPHSRKKAKEGLTTPDLLIHKTRDGANFAGKKPKAFTHWLLDLMQYQEGDEVIDLFNGSGAVQNAIESYFDTPSEQDLS